MKRLLLLLLLPALAPALLLTACGDDGSAAEPTETVVVTETATTDGTATDAGGTGDLTDADVATITDTVTQWLLTADCDLATDDYLLALDFFETAKTPEEACQSYRDLWTEPAFTADDIRVDGVTGGDGEATAVVGDHFSNIETQYGFAYEDGTWKVDSDEFTSDE